MIFIWSKCICGILESGVELMGSGGTRVKVMDFDGVIRALVIYCCISEMEVTGISSIAMI